ncbi:LuxR C-terminal-related transcriptional regulator [Streptomyces sp. NPDC048340]|uniref:helix-turn-helix transcriptional regulator n=1 Tax=Streptomyces sp. NPDC048340 TaxID=3365537 RepID=UPI003710AEAE
MTYLRRGDYRRLWTVAARGITCDHSEFPGALADAGLAEAFHADVVDACEMDLHAGRSRQVAAHPAELLTRFAPEPAEFHTYLTGHPAVRYYQHGGPDPAVDVSRLSTRNAWRATSTYGYLHEHCGMSEQLVIRVKGSPARVHGLAVMRATRAFTALDLAMASELGAVLSAVHRLRFAELAQETDVVRLTRRESEVLALWQYGLTGRAIARRLGITPRTVDKHAENLRHKLGTPDRTSTVLRAQALGLLAADARPGL